MTKYRAILSNSAGPLDGIPGDTLKDLQVALVRTLMRNEWSLEAGDTITISVDPGDVLFDDTDPKQFAGYENPNWRELTAKPDLSLAAWEEYAHSMRTTGACIASYEEWLAARR